MSIDAIAQLIFTGRCDRGQARLMQALHRHQGTLLVAGASDDTMLPVRELA